MKREERKEEKRKEKKRREFLAAKEADENN